MSTLYAMATTQVASPNNASVMLTVPEYYSTFLSGVDFVAFYFNNGASVLVACEDNSGLDAADDVLVIDPANLDSIMSDDDSSTLGSLAGAVQASPGGGAGNLMGAGSGGSGGGSAPQTYQSALQALNNNSSIVMNDVTI
jgi:hypothetical protein